MATTLWNKCLDRLEGEFSPQQFNTWIRPLHAIEDGDSLRLLAPNHFVRDWVNEHLLNRLTEVLARLQNGHAVQRRRADREPGVHRARR